MVPFPGVRVEPSAESVRNPQGGENCGCAGAPAWGSVEDPEPPRSRTSCIGKHPGFLEPSPCVGAPGPVEPQAEAPTHGDSSGHSRSTEKRMPVEIRRRRDSEQIENRGREIPDRPCGGDGLDRGARDPRSRRGRRVRSCPLGGSVVRDMHPSDTRRFARLDDAEIFAKGHHEVGHVRMGVGSELLPCRRRPRHDRLSRSRIDELEEVAAYLVDQLGGPFRRNSPERLAAADIDPDPAASIAVERRGLRP